MYGWDFGSDEEEDGDNDPCDYRWHGTHCAGIVGALGNNDEGVCGVCWNATIMNVKIFPAILDGNETTMEAFTSQAIDGIEYAVMMGADILSCSWRLYDTPVYAIPQALKDAIDDAGDAGVLVVAGAGNEGVSIDTEGNEKYPASYNCNNIIAVMATDRDDERSEWSSSASNWGSTSVDLAAQGTDIRSTTPTYLTTGMQNDDIDTDYDNASGTSMATPHVAGACALVWAAYPQLSHLQVRQAILDNVDVLEDLDGLCATEGRLNVHKALASLNTTCVFSVENSSSERVARFDEYGNLFLEGTLTEDDDPSATGSDEFLVQNSSSTDVANINMITGNMIIDGLLYPEQTSLSPTGSNDFRIKNSSGNDVAYVDESGNPYLLGTVFENSDP